MTNYIQIINNYGELYSKWEKCFLWRRSKQLPAKMTLVLAVHLNDRQHGWHLCWRSFKWPASTNWSVLAGRPPTSTKGHFYWLKVAGGCRARQQKPVLAAGTNRFWPSGELCLEMSCSCIMYLQRYPSLLLEAVIISSFPYIPKKQESFE
jgi:hypothetical protein